MQVYEKKTLAQIFCCEYCKIKNNYFQKQLRMAASALF